MSSLFSDPPFPRGKTLLGGSPASLTDAGIPIEGNEIQGEVKCFIDTNPTSSQVLSQRLVYCVAVRVKQGTVANGQPATDLLPGTVVKFALGSSSTLDIANTAAASDTAAIAHQVGVVDEYLTGVPYVNDIIWIVVKGPTTALFTAPAVSAGSPVLVSSVTGQLVQATSPSILSTFAGTALAAKSGVAAGPVRVNLSNADF